MRAKSHKEIENICDATMASMGWERVGCKATNDTPVSFWDRVYTKEDLDYPVVFEIKPETATSEEIKRGIGQIACTLPYQVRPYLIISEDQYLMFKEIFELLLWLGICLYDDRKLLLPVKQRASLDYHGQTELLTRKLPKVKKSIRWEQVVDIARGLSGLFTVKDFTEILKGHYPGLKISANWVGEILVNSGYARKFKGTSVAYDLGGKVDVLGV